MKPIATVLIPNYKTPDITKLCLRLISKYTDLSRIHVIAIDNNSDDESLEYLRSLHWIELIERNPEADDTAPLSHSRALDLGFEKVNTPYVFSFHTDTFVRRDDWLDFMLKQLEMDKDIAGVGSWKLEVKPTYKLVLKRIEAFLESSWYSFFRGKDKSSLKGTSFHKQYLRSHCALYRTDLIRDYGLKFSEGKDTAGKIIHEYLVQHGYKMIFLPPEILIKYMVHLNHATMVLNPDLSSRPKSIRKGLRRIRKILNELQAEKILADDSLDAMLET